ncbi:protocatechuate 3,4-dioxygenase, alpha subunit [Roseivivax lentus]|uniref:Protocatechuate 3,4-dioxygenase, alpha subunit n=1 Tax=Roseivivax lentus TaxID=633194 RepID=A0A1N7PY73_9RHOB|nr:protocatechuate 3,4-dioxygenase subunit alpha [Roseivivax lentus]SIT15389.1 protocatechuate 3,4-dioxygenase, alpha subunit [Roseivivax lentus]
MSGAADRPADLKESPSQTAGPYVHIGCLPNHAGLGGPWAEDLGARPFADDAPGTRVVVTGCLLDGTGTPLRDAMVEIWQADAAGRYAGGGAAGFARRASDAETGLWRLETIKPGAVPGPDGRIQAPHLTLWIVARGINLGLHTRMYFPDETAANAADPVLGRIEQTARARTLVAEARGDGVYHFDIHLQGEKETVFFDV